MPDELTPNFVERPDCHHMQTIMARPALNLSDYNSRLVPFLQEAIKEPCPECERLQAEQVKQKLVKDMKEKVKK